MHCTYLRDRPLDDRQKDIGVSIRESCLPHVRRREKSIHHKNLATRLRNLSPSQKMRKMKKERKRIKHETGVHDAVISQRRGFSPPREKNREQELTRARGRVEGVVYRYEDSCKVATTAIQPSTV
ncbi:hypothetical protein TSAR_015203 [Trichomalopsis sarcophagae]|uniref:Uncharacterized protein n=1 Tax=Trichomalopsis sarcophagae TaxID=543379 RepID=A0A232FG05_9HYME|nr:hypothetical protein TSAR_015203 [Trichomalopsis sarcophagae]